MRVILRVKKRREKKFCGWKGIRIRRPVFRSCDGHRERAERGGVGLSGKHVSKSASERGQTMGDCNST